MKNIIAIVILLCVASVAKAIAGSLDYTTYYVSTYAPSLENPYYDNVTGYNSDGSNSSPNGLGSVLSTGTISTISGFDWGSGQVLDSGRSDQVAVKVTGYITWPGTSGQQTTVYFGIRADDGFLMNIDGVNVVQDWQQQGPGYWNSTGSLTRTGGQQYAITVWMYEWGGGAVLDAHYSLTGYSTGQQINIPTSMFSTTMVTPTAGITSSQTTQINTARGVTHSGNGIYIDQVGDNNDLDVVQDGNDNLIAGVSSTTNSLIDADITGNNNTTTLKQKGNNNVMLFDITGNTNTTTVDQGSTSGADDNRVEFDINGDTNTTSITQNHNNGVGTNGHFLELDLDGDNNNVLTSQLNDGDKKAFISVQGDDNDIDLYQQGAGSHYVEIEVGSNQTVDITQDGSGNHNASISMSGFDAGLDLTQDSSTDQTYSLSQNCNNANGCGTTTVTQN
jgi:hypothetical protein